MFRPEEQKLVAGFCHSCYWIATFVGNKVFLYLVEMFGLATMFFIISMLMVLCFIFTWLQVPETRQLKDETERIQGILGEFYWINSLNHQLHLKLLLRVKSHGYVFTFKRLE